MLLVVSQLSTRVWCRGRRASYTELRIAGLLRLKRLPLSLDDVVTSLASLVGDRPLSFDFVVFNGAKSNRCLFSLALGSKLALVSNQAEESVLGRVEGSCRHAGG
jgi:hypothetical protein